MAEVTSIDQLLSQMVQLQASDLHVTVGAVSAQVVAHTKTSASVRRVAVIDISFARRRRSDNGLGGGGAGLRDC